MRSFDARSDTRVVDEPLYAAYLAATGMEHPGRGEILASQPNDWARVAAGLTGPAPRGATIWYQKHMAHHLLPEFGREWLGSLRHAFLVRDPAYVVASYARVRETPTLADLGFEQQLELFRTYGGPVIDSADVLRDPEGVLRRLCAALDIAFDTAMLRWEPGRRPADGVWAPYWYAAVEASTGFAPYDDSPADVAPHLQPLVEAAMPAYEELESHRLRA